jgi:hypothetical protein
MRLFNAIELVLAFSLLSALTTTATAQPAPPRGGNWQLDEEDPDHPALVFKQGEDVIFYVAGGDAVELWIAWPGLPQPEGNASVTIRTTTRAFTVKGGLTNEHPFTRGDEQSTYFQHADTGLSRDFNAFIDALLASKDVVVATKSGTITMPRIDVKDAKRVRL